MSKEFSRTDQLEALMQREISTIIQHKLNDPRTNYQFVSVTAVSVTRDLDYAKVYISSLDLEQGNEQLLIKALNHASGFIRTLLGRELKTRRVPQLTFIYDTSIRYGNKLSQLIDNAVASDLKSHQKSDNE